MAELTQPRILEAARTCFAHQGYAGTTIVEVCRMAGVAPATLYRYFESKRALFEAAGGFDLPGGAENPRRREILESALELFSQHGYQATTMSDIAAQAGVARGTLYAQFPTKQAILIVLLEDNPVLEVAQQLSSHSNGFPGMDAVRDLEFLAYQCLLTFQEPRRIALLRLVLTEGIRVAPLQGAYHEFIGTGLEVISQYLARILPGLEDPRFTARLFMGSLLGFVWMQRVIPGSPLPIYPPEVIARRIAAQLLFGIQALSSESDGRSRWR